MICASFFDAGASNHRVVIAGVPNRIPDGSSGFLVSNGIIFLLVETPILSRIFSASFPDIPRDQKISSKTIWLSVPHDMTLMPLDENSFAITRELSTTCRTYVENSGWSASPNAIALASVVWSCGHHWIPGNTALAIIGPNFSLDIIIAPRGHLSVLCVVVVTTSQYGTGFSRTHPAISHAICAISAISIAPTSSAIWRNLFQSSEREYAENPAMMSFGLCSFANCSTISMSINSVDLSTPYGIIWNIFHE